MSSDNESYEIYAVAKKNWRLLSRVTSSGQAIEAATELQHSQKYSAIRVVVRPPDDAANRADRLLYQFIRPGADSSLPPAFPQPVAEAPAVSTGDALAAPKARRHLLVAGCWGVAAVLLVTFVLSD